MTIGEHYSLKVFGDYLGEAFLNTFTYRQTAGANPNEAAELAQQFDASLMFDLTGCVGDQVNFNRIECFSIETPTDYADITPVNNVGLRAIGTALRTPSWMAFGFRSNRAGAGSRSSYKRFCGLGETDVEQNVLAAAFLALPSVPLLQSALYQTMIFGGVNTWVPVQLKAGWLIGFPPVENFAISAYALAYLTSQVSRRP